jgi:hypothetical protein
LGGFNSHLVNSRKPKASAATRRSNLDYFIDNLDELLLPDIARQVERTSVFDATSTHAALGLLRLDSNQYKKATQSWSLSNLEDNSNRSEEATQSWSLSDLEDDLDRLLKIRDEGATARRGPPLSTITLT